MKKYRLQNRIVGSVFTLPACVVWAVVVWCFSPNAFEGRQIIGFLLVALVTYVLLETNNRFHLIRIRSRLVASVWLVSASAITSMHVGHFGLLSALFLAAAQFCLFSTLDKREPVSYTFHTGLFLGLAALFTPWLSFLLPLFLLHQLVFLRSLTLRCFFAMLLGFLFPALVAVLPCLWQDDYDLPVRYVSQLTDYRPVSWASYRCLTVQQALSWLLPFLLAVLGGCHYLSTSFNDKINVRMVLYILTINGFFIQAFGTLQPQYAELLLPSMLVCGTPLVAHFFALTHGWFTNFLFVLSLLAYLALTYFTLLCPALPLDAFICSLFSL